MMDPGDVKIKRKLLKYIYFFKLFAKYAHNSCEYKKKLWTFVVALFILMIRVLETSTRTLFKNIDPNSYYFLSFLGAFWIWDF